MEKVNRIRIKAITVAILILLANYIQILQLSRGQLQIIDFRCDAEYLGNKRYSADVNQEITFTYDAESYFRIALFLGDGTYIDYIEDSTITHIYESEGIYNVTFWIFGAGASQYDSDWLILEVLNEAPEFDIGYTAGEFHDATSHFEDDELEDNPQEWIAYNNEGDFYLSDDTNVFPGVVLGGGIENLTIEDQISWELQSQWTGGSYRYIEIFLKFEENQNHELTPGQYQLYFSANDSFSLLGFNPSLGENEILFNGNYSNGEIITLSSKSLGLFASYYIENWASAEKIKIDWFKLKKVYKGVEIVKDFYGYGKVVQLKYGTPSHHSGITQSFSSKKYGTIEFWYNTKNSLLGASMRFGLSDLVITQNNNKMFMGTKEITPGDSPIMNNTWYHLRIDFNIEGPIYEGLYSGEGRVFLNGIPSDFLIPLSISNLNFFTVESNGTAYVDAIGYSWDKDYYIGKNIEKIIPDILYEDLEITFSIINMIESITDKEGFSYENKNEISPNYQYIWDFGDGNYSYDESPSYRFSNAGEFPVRVTLIDDQGAMKTQVKTFNINNKEPETDIKYGLNYQATYDFKYDISEQAPSDLITHGSVEVVDFKDEFSKVVEIDSTAGGYGMIRIPEPSLELNGSMEFWVYFTDTDNDEFFFWFDKLDPNDENLYVLQNSTRFGYLNGKWMYYYAYKGAGNVDKYAYGEMIELPTPINNEWTHIRFDYCWSDEIDYNGLTGKQCRLYVNGFSSNIYQAVGDQFNRKGFDIRSGSKIYLESIGFTTDPDYNLGDNNPERLETYYGTWDFRFYPNGPVPFDETLQSTILGPWVFGSYNFEEIANNCSANILNELDGHHKVLELQDNNSTDLVFASLIDLAEPNLGSLEFWLRTTDTSQGLVMALGYEIFQSGIWLGEDGKWWYKNGAQYLEITDVPKMLNNSWHHIRIDFNCTSSKFYFAVDGNYSMQGPFDFDYNVDNFGWNIWSTVHEGYNYSIYLDSIGGSWDPAYDVGDNMATREAINCDEEIIFSADSMDTKTDKEGLRYLWNFGDNQTGFGQTVLHSYSRAGKYKVKLIAIDDNAEYEIAEKYLWIDNVYPDIDITEITYGKTTYDFTYDNVGEFPNGWFMSDLEELLGSSTQVVPNIDIFRNAILIGNGTGVGGIWTSDVNGLPFNQTVPGDLSLYDGTIEFWIYTTDASKSQLYISFFQDSYLDGIFIEFINGTWLHNGVEIDFESSWGMESNTWTHLRIDFSCDNNGYMGLGNDDFIIYADGFASQNLDMVHNYHIDISNLTCFGVFTQMYQNESTNVYVDNFGFSWDSEYQVGDNEFKFIQYQFNEGDTIILDCMSYDTYTDYQRLIYNWGNLDMNIGEWQDLGWHYSYTFMDNDDGDELEGYPIVSFVGDPLYMWDLDSYYIEVDNVLPEFNIHTAKVISNVSLSIFNDSNEAANFTIYLQSLYSNQTLFVIPYTSDFSGDWVSFNSTIIEMLASYEWDVIVNQTGREGGEHIVQLNFQYENGFELPEVMNFNGGSTLWTIDIDDQWTDSSNELSYVPLTFIGTVADPSDDKIELGINYVVEYTHEVASDTPLIEINFTISHNPNDILWNYNVIEDGPNKYAINKFTVAIQDDWNDNLISGNFPVAYDISFEADLSGVDFYNHIDDLFATEGVNVISFDSIDYSIEGQYREFESYSITKNFDLNYSISDNFEFSNLAPSIKIEAPLTISEDQTITYFATVVDMNGDSMNVSMSFGINDGSGLFYRKAEYLGDNFYGVNYTYTNEGKYLINVLATDGLKESKTIQLIDVTNLPPYAKINSVQNVTSEDEYIQFIGDLYDTESDVDSLRYYWDFGDGVFSADENPSHAYFQAGEYTIRLNVRDDNGATFTATYNLTVVDEPPDIYGPFTFNGAEGQTIILDVDISDSISDFEMNYTWDLYKAVKIYNATYNFMDVDEGNIPGSPFEFTTANNVHYKVVEELAGHVKVLEIYDNNDMLNGSWNLKYGDTTSVNGSVEFWLRSTHISPDESNFAINLLQYGTVMMPIYVSDNGTWIYKNIFTDNQTNIPNIPKLISNTWHHIRIDYECSNGGYSGLGENQWRLIIDGVNSPILDLQFGSFPNDDANYLDCLQIISGDPNEMSIYCDAIGYYNANTEYELGGNVDQIFEKYEFIKTFYGKKPSAAFDEGSYLITLTVDNGLSSQTDIKLEVQAVAPILAVPSKNYYGHTGYIDITAYARDSIIDSTSLEFEWLIKGKRFFVESGTLSSKVSVFCNETGLIKGRVSVRDSADLSATSDFSVKVYMDSNGDGYSNEWELLNNITSIDADNDGLPNFYEELTIGTNMTLWDTDDDLLSDGFSSDILSGELTIGTDPLDNDTDDDLLFDGFEWFGWNHTLSIHGEMIKVTYFSNPLVVDSDGDSLSDYEEFNLKTDPLKQDTDDDMLTDIFEVYEYGSNPYVADTDNDGLIDGIEYEIGTYFNITDTDEDGISDGEEYYGWGFTSNPLTKDTDHDFLADNSETLLITYEIDGRMSVKTPTVLNFRQKNVDKAESAVLTFMLTYGEITPEELLTKFRIQIYKHEDQLIIYDSILNIYGNERYFTETVDFKDIIENAGKSYSGNYILKVSYARYPHGELALEAFKIAVHRYLDPNDEDFDDDGIMDGVESQLIVEGVKIEDLIESNPLTADTNTTTYDEFIFEISDIGLINDADISFSIESNHTLLGNGGVFVKVIQKELSNRIEEKVIFSLNITFSTNDNFEENYNIKPYSTLPYNYYGKYRFIFDIYSTNNFDGFNLLNLQTEIEGHREAIKTDLRAWITNPDLWDSDGDGWSDYFEINRGEQTNPLAWDTDGDGVKDSRDIDPLYDIILEINLIEGHVGDLPGAYALINPNPNLQMTVNYVYQGKTVAYCSNHQRASTGSESTGLFNVVKYKGTAVFNRKHYIDVDDDQYSMRFTVKLWDEGLFATDWLWDTFKTSKISTFNLRSNVRDTPKNVKSSGTNWVEFEITKRGLTRANTIAVYNNETLFNGHYNYYDKMHVFQINITEVVSPNLPFVGGLTIDYGFFKISFPGINYLLIPNSIFINTVLNSIIQNEDRLGASFLANGEFAGIDRDDLPAVSSNHIESLFLIACTYAQAMEILNWSLWGVINETTQELGKINLYSSSNVPSHNCRAEMMNLHPDVLGAIVFIQSYRDHFQGSMPLEYDEWWAAVAKALIQFFVDVLTFIIDIIIAVLKFLVAAALEILAFLLKVALFVYILLMIGISTIICLAAIGIIAGVLAATVVAIEGFKAYVASKTDLIYAPFPWEMLYLGIYLYFKWFDDLFEITMGIEYPWVYNDFLGFNMPTILSYTNLVIPVLNLDMTINYRFNHFGIDMEIEDFVSEDEMWDDDTHDVLQILTLIGGIMGLSGAVFALVGGILAITVSEPVSGVIAVIGGMAGFIISLLTFFAFTMGPVEDNQMLEEASWGFGIGLLISAVVILSPTGFLRKMGEKLIKPFIDKTLIKKLNLDVLIKTSLSVVKIGIPNSAAKAGISAFSGFLACVAGAGAFTAAEKSNPVFARVAQTGLGIVCIALSVFFLGQALINLFENEESE